MDGPKPPTLASIADGAAEELFANALAQVLANIDDPNTDAKAARAITITVTMKPNEQRAQASVVVKCATKLAGISPVGTVVLMGQHHGKLAMAEALGQEKLFPEAQGRPRALPQGA